MTTQFEIKGEWFLPRDDTRRVYGVLKFRPNQSVQLELYGGFDRDDFFAPFEDQEIILGLSSESELVTLTDCSMMSSGSAKLIQGQESGKPSTAYTARFIVVGIHVMKKADLVFDTISSEIFNFGEWVGVSGFKKKEEMKDRKVTVEYKLPDPIEFEIDEETSGAINFVASGPTWYRYQKKVEISQRVEFMAKSRSDKTISELLDYIFGFQNLLILALYGTTYPLRISLVGKNFQTEYSDEMKVPTKIKLFFSVSNFKEDDKPKLDLELIFDFGSIKGDFQIIIRNWFAKYRLLKPALDLLIEQFHRRNQFTTNTFLNLAQSAETFHARTNNHTRMPREEYEKMKVDIMGLAPQEHREWLLDQFNFGNDLRLHMRLSEMTDKYANDVLDVIIPDREEFVKQVKHSRNYFTHYSSDAKKKALHGSDLYYLSERLKLLLVCAFLTEIGFTKELISTGLDRVKWRLFNHLADWKNKKSKDQL